MKYHFAKQEIMINKNELRQFLNKAKKATYAQGSATEPKIENDGSATLFCREGKWRYNVNYFRGEPYGGREVVFYDNKPVYLMCYYGSTSSDFANYKVVYELLQKAMELAPKSESYKKPIEYSKDGFVYTNAYHGSFESFWGEETIRKGERVVYRVRYLGGTMGN
jgi:hypothetical protein